MARVPEFHCASSHLLEGEYLQRTHTRTTDGTNDPTWAAPSATLRKKAEMAAHNVYLLRPVGRRRNRGGGYLAGASPPAFLYFVSTIKSTQSLSVFHFLHHLLGHLVPHTP